MERRKKIDFEKNKFEFFFFRPGEFFCFNKIEIEKK